MLNKAESRPKKIQIPIGSELKHDTKKKWKLVIQRVKSGA